MVLRPSPSDIALSSSCRTTHATSAVLDPAALRSAVVRRSDFAAVQNSARGMSSTLHAGEKASVARVYGLVPLRSGLRAASGGGIVAIGPPPRMLKMDD